VVEYEQVLADEVTGVELVTLLLEKGTLDED